MPRIGTMNNEWYVAFTGIDGYTRNAYLCADGVVRECSRHDNHPEIWYETAVLAQEALKKYNKKGNIMKKEDLRTGMLLQNANGALFKVLIGTDSSNKDNDNRGNIALSSSGYGWLYLSNFNEDLTDKRSKNNDIIAVYRPSRNFQNIFTYDLDECDIVWERKVPPTVMTIADLEKKLGITNLQIKD